MFGLDRARIRSFYLLLARRVRSYRFALAAFLIPVFIRSILETLVGLYPVGWVTVALNVPKTLDGDGRE